MHLRAVALAAVLLARLSSPVRAEEEWYGHHVLAIDVGGSALFVGGFFTDLPTPVWVSGVAVMVLGGPIVHVAHDNDGRAAASLGLRVGGALGGAAVGGGIISAYSSDGGDGSERPIESIVYPAVGAFFGYVAAAVIDIAVIAREDDAPAARMFSVGGSF